MSQKIEKEIQDDKRYLLIVLPAEDAYAIIDEICHQRGYEPNIGNPDFDMQKPISESNPTHIPNPETPAMFAKRDIVSYGYRMLETRTKRLAEEEMRKKLLETEVQIRAKYD